MASQPTDNRDDVEPSPPGSEGQGESNGLGQGRGAVEKFAEWAERELQEKHSIEGTRTGLGRYVVFHESGWPTLAMSSIRYELTAYVPLGLGGGRRYQLLDQGIPLRTSQLHLVLMGPKQLPLRLIWPGFAINTVFYAAILWLLFAAPFALRRRRRIKRGLCPACAYPVSDSPVCTECGRPVPKRHITVAV